MNLKLNKSDYTVLLITYSSIVIFNCIEYFFQNRRFIEYLIDIPISILTSFSVILVFIYWLIPNFIVKKRQYVAFVLFGIITLLVFGLLDYTAGFYSMERNWSEYPKWNKLFILSVFRTVNYAGFTYGILLAKKFYENQSQMASIKQKQRENELKLLRSQIDPHFLFNNLNTLDSLIDIDTKKAKEYINRLSLIYRYLIKTKDAEVMELSEEIQLAKNYIFLIETRFDKDYSFNIIENTTLLNKFIPTGALQSLLENIIKHNKNQQQYIIKAIITVNEDWIIILNQILSVIKNLLEQD